MEGKPFNPEKVVRDHLKFMKIHNIELNCSDTNYINFMTSPDNDEEELLLKIVVINKVSEDMDEVNRSDINLIPFIRRLFTKLFGENKEIFDEIQGKSLLNVFTIPPLEPIVNNSENVGNYPIQNLIFVYYLFHYSIGDEKIRKYIKWMNLPKTYFSLVKFLYKLDQIAFFTPPTNNQQNFAIDQIPIFNSVILNEYLKIPEIFITQMYFVMIHKKLFQKAYEFSVHNQSIPNNFFDMKINVNLNFLDNSFKIQRMEKSPTKQRILLYFLFEYIFPTQPTQTTKRTELEKRQKNIKFIKNVEMNELERKYLIKYLKGTKQYNELFDFFVYKQQYQTALMLYHSISCFHMENENVENLPEKSVFSEKNQYIALGLKKVYPNVTKDNDNMMIDDFNIQTRTRNQNTDKFLSGMNDMFAAIEEDVANPSLYVDYRGIISPKPTSTEEESDEQKIYLNDESNNDDEGGSRVNGREYEEINKAELIKLNRKRKLDIFEITNKAGGEDKSTEEREKKMRKIDSMVGEIDDESMDDEDDEDDERDGRGRAKKRYYVDENEDLPRRGIRRYDRMDEREDDDDDEEEEEIEEEGESDDDESSSSSGRGYINTRDRKRGYRGMDRRRMNGNNQQQHPKRGTDEAPIEISDSD